MDRLPQQWEALEACQDFNEALVTDIQRQWAIQLETDLGFLDRLYAFALEKLEGFPLPGQGAKINPRQAKTLFHFLTCFSSPSYLRNLGSYCEDAKWSDYWRYFDDSGKTDKAAAALKLYSKKLLHLVERFLEVPDFEIFRFDQSGGAWSNVVGMLLELQFWHSSFSNDEYRIAAAPYVLPFAGKFPDFDGRRRVLNTPFADTRPILLTDLEHHPDAVGQYAALITLLVLRGVISECGFGNRVALRMFELRPNVETFGNKHALAILEALFARKPNWTADEADYFMAQFVVYPLQLDESEQTYTEAIKRVAVNKATRECLAYLLQHLTMAATIARVQRLYDDALAFIAAPKMKFDIEQKPTVEFKDLYFKLLVIEELMYSQDVLQPRFNLEEFAAEYTKREISPDSLDWDVKPTPEEFKEFEIFIPPVPEVLQYFQNLDIPQSLLDKVTTLYQDSGLGGGAEIYYQLFAKSWDPGCGDGVLKVSDKMIDDLSLLPNLKTITGLENSSPSGRLLEAIKARGIELIKEH